MTRDLFEHAEELPNEIIEILESIDIIDASDDLDYNSMSKALKKCETLGYTFEFGLDLVPYQLTKMELFLLKSVSTWIEIPTFRTTGAWVRNGVASEKKPTHEEILYDCNHILTEDVSKEWLRSLSGDDNQLIAELAIKHDKQFLNMITVSKPKLQF